jgi:hypothetical protein
LFFQLSLPAYQITRLDCQEKILQVAGAVKIARGSLLFPRMTPEVSLWLEVILSALADLFLCSRDVHGSAALQCQEDARLWFESEDDGIGTFLYCCHVLGIDPGAVRRGLRQADLAGVQQRLKRNSNFFAHPTCDPLDLFEVSAGRRVSA